MNCKSEFKRLFRDAFTETQGWLDRFADTVYRDEDFVYAESDDRIVSGLLLTPYDMRVQTAVVQLGYISCVATLREYRGRGLMHQLMPRALNVAAERGMALCGLIPASDHLYFLYDRFGFATVCYIEEQRYTSLHRFGTGDGFMPVEPNYEMFARLQGATVCGVLHNREQYRQVTEDMAAEGGRVLAVEGPNGSCAMAFVTIGKEATVKYLPATDGRAAEAALGLVRDAAGELPVIVWAAPGDRRQALRSRGMMRVTDAAAVLGALAAERPDTEQLVRVRDPLIAANNAVFSLHAGECERVEHTLRRITLDVDVQVLTSIVMSAARIGDVFGLPTARPMMPLMLD